MMKLMIATDDNDNVTEEDVDNHDEHEVTHQVNDTSSSQPDWDEDGDELGEPEQEVDTDLENKEEMNEGKIQLNACCRCWVFPLRLFLN